MMEGASRICSVCFRHCRLEEGQTGACRARRNLEGRIIDVNYGMVTSLALDPIEKKPLAMFCPGSRILSIGSFGCNLKCPFCQNHEISMMGEKDMCARYFPPEEILAEAVANKRRGNIGVAYTYNEPLVGWEYVRDTSKLVHDEGLKNVMVTNGCASLEILEKLLPNIDAMNIDLKGFTQEYYDYLGGDLEMVKAFIRRAVRGCHVEVTTLIVPGKNDSEQEMEKISAWLASIRRGIPLHVTRCFPRYRFREPPADVGLIYRLADTARKNLTNVFTGNC